MKCGIGCTHVCRSGWGSPLANPFMEPSRLPASFSFSSPEELVDTDVEKCLEADIRVRPAAGAVVVMVVVPEVLLFVELARKRD